MDKYNINIMKYIKTFEQHDDYVDYTESQDYITPNLSYCIEENETHFEKLKDYSDKYFTIEALENGNVYFKYAQDTSTTEQRYTEYSKDGGATWNRTTNVDNEEITMTIPLLAGETVILRGDNDTFYSASESGVVKTDIMVNVSGNILSLICGDNFETATILSPMAFYCFFLGIVDTCNIVNACNLVLPSSGLSDYCYNGMFSGCTSLTTAPELPATTLAEGCYGGMFAGCTSLTTAPELPATTLVTECYTEMFFGCEALTTVPELPATTLADYCYNGMFSGCTSLTTAPELPATTLAEGCYSGMFAGCTSLTTAPELPATTLVNNCYGLMFKGCSSLNYIKALFRTIPSTTYTNQWVYEVASTGTFVKSSVAAWNVTGVHGVPSGWTVQTISGNG